MSCTDPTCNHVRVVDRIDCCSGDRCFCGPRSTRPHAQAIPARSVSPEPSPLERHMSLRDLVALGVIA